MVFCPLIGFLIVEMIQVDIPVRTAQGGGGSFKDRKAIGEVRCWESNNGSANPPLDRQAIGTSSYPSVFVSVHR